MHVHSRINNIIVSWSHKKEAKGVKCASFWSYLNSNYELIMFLTTLFLVFTTHSLEDRVKVIWKKGKSYVIMCYFYCRFFIRHTINYVQKSPTFLIYSRKNCTNSIVIFFQQIRYSKRLLLIILYIFLNCQLNEQ